MNSYQWQQLCACIHAHIPRYMYVHIHTHRAYIYIHTHAHTQNIKQKKRIIILCRKIQHVTEGHKGRSWKNMDPNTSNQWKPSPQKHNSWLKVQRESWRPGGVATGMEALQTTPTSVSHGGLARSPPIAQMSASAFWKLLSFRPEQMQLAESKWEAFKKQQEMKRQRARSETLPRDPKCSVQGAGSLGVASSDLQIRREPLPSRQIFLTHRQIAEATLTLPWKLSVPSELLFCCWEASQTRRADFSFNL